MKTLKVLVSAYACRPGEGSEPGVGWNTVKELAKYHKVWVFTRKGNRPSIEAELARCSDPHLQFVYCDFPLSQWWRQSLQSVHFHYYLWQLRAYFIARKLHREVGFDVVHHVTYVRYSSPSFLSLLPIPFIWGPIGGGELAPEDFWKDFSWRGKIYEIIRLLAHRLGEQDPFTRLTAKRSVLAWATTEDTAKRLRKLGATNVQVQSQLGLSKEDIARFATLVKPKSSSTKFISIGRLLHWKGFHLGLQAFALANLPPHTEYWIVGDGPERVQLQNLSKKLGIDKKVKFWGQLTREETLRKLGECSVLIHPSLHESGGLVCLEAMAAGCPVVCLDLGGPALQVTEKSGIKVPTDTSTQTIRHLATALTKLANCPEIRVHMSQEGQQRVSQDYSWNKKGKRLLKTYEELLK